MGLDFSLKCDCCDSYLAEFNITHNLKGMAKVANVYKLLWHPEEADVEFARECIHTLQYAISVMEADPLKFKQYDSPNGWGVYEDFLGFCKDVLAACKKYPRARVEADR